MSSIIGLSTAMLKYVNDESIKTIMSLMEKLDPAFTGGFIRELEQTLTANTRILLLEGANPQINVDYSLNTALTQLLFIKPYYKDTPYERDINRIEKQLMDIMSYIDKYVHMNFQTNGLDMDTAILQDFKQHAEVKETANSYYITALSRVYTFAKDAKKSTKFPTKNSPTIKHNFVIPERLGDLIEENDLALKYLAVISSLTETRSKTSRTDLLHLFMYIDRITNNDLKPYFENLGLLNPDGTIGLPNFNMEEFKTVIYNNLLFSAFRAFSTVFPDAIDTLDIDTTHFTKQDNPHTGYNIDKFVIYDYDMLNNSDEETVKTLARLWRAYVYYQPILAKQTSIPGYVPEYHWALKYDRATVPKRDAHGNFILTQDGQYVPVRIDIPYDLKGLVSQLVDFSIKVIVDAEKRNIKLPRSYECERLLNKFLEILSKEQFTSKELYRYNETCIKTANYLIPELDVQRCNVEDDINELVAKLNAGNVMYEETKQVISSIIQELQTLQFCLSTTDWGQVPYDFSEWATHNGYLGERLFYICEERKMLLYCYERFKACYETVRFKSDIFADGITERLNKEKINKITLSVASKKQSDGTVIYSLNPTYEFNSKWKNKIYNDVYILQNRVKFITEYENAYQSKDGNFLSIKKDYRKFVNNATSMIFEDSTIINDALILHYGHAEISPSFSEYLARESRLEPTKIEQSRTKHIIESTIESHQNLYLKLEAREFMLQRLHSDEMMVEPIW